MEIRHLCAMLKQRVSVQLLEAADPQERSEILIAALYEMSRSVLPLLGSPGSSRQYLDCQGSVLDLISFLALGLIRGPVPERRGVAVLAEIGEGCPDPLLRKKLRIYAHELLIKSNSRLPHGNAARKRRGLSWLLGAFAAALLVLYLSWLPPSPGGQPAAVKTTAATVPEAGPGPSAATFVPPALKAPAEAASRERSEELFKQGDRPVAEPGSGALQGEQTTRIRIVNNQVLVPVMLKNGGETVMLELVLDTGASRTVIHDVAAGRLQIDLRLAKPSWSEVADGRVIRSRIAKIDSLAVGPYLLAPAELELIAYNGTEGGRDGLLGMDFLGKHRYQIDMEHESIRWF